LIGAVRCVIVGGLSRRGVTIARKRGHTLEAVLTRHQIHRLTKIAASTLGALVLIGGSLLPAIGVAPAALAVGPADKAEVVLVFDFSSSILDDAATRNQFGAALERIADRVDETARDLIAGDTTISIVQFGRKAADVPKCQDIQTLGSPFAVQKLSGCLRTVAAEYKKGRDPGLTKSIGLDTNYVAAMQAAAGHLPKDATRPTMILFTDGKHDVPGVPVSQVQPTRDTLFGAREPFALLPVGMGLKAADRPTLGAGLTKLTTINNMPPCSSGKKMEWPTVVFDTPEDAGSAVADALERATCTFTAVPVATPPPQSNAVENINLAPRDGAAVVDWDPPTTPATDPIVSYRVRCTPDGGADPVESTQPASPDNSTVIEGLTNGTAYTCEVAADTATKKGDWTKADATVTPAPVPSAPSKPKVEAADRAIQINAAAGGGPAAASLLYECSSDGGKTWPATAEVQTSTDTKAQIGGLKNGTAYVCRATATNDSGTGAASPLSDAVTPCDGFIECNGLVLPIAAGLGAVVAVALLLGFLVLGRNRTGSYVVAVVDTVHSANLGGGSNLGLALLGGPYARQLEGISAAKGKKADVRIHKLRGDRFRVTDKRGSQEVRSGEAVIVESRNGVRHELVLRAFEGRAASGVTVRR
jgi:hypothetical protein